VLCSCVCLTVEEFDLAERLNTAPELVGRAYNRPTLDTLKTKSIQGATDTRTVEVRVPALHHYISLDGHGQQQSKV